MAKAQRRYRGVDLEARRKAFGEIYVWLYRRHDGLLRNLAARTPAFWVVTAEDMATDGIRSRHGLVPSPNAARLAWRDVTLHHADDAKRYAEGRETDEGHVSRRHKGWVPTSRDPLPSDQPTVQSATPSTRVPAPPPPRAAPTPPAPTALTVALGPNEAAPLGHPDHPLGPLTDLEIAKLAKYPNASLEVQARVLKTYRTIRHMDRFSRPNWE